MSRPRPIPTDARDVLPTMTPSAAAAHYGAGLDTIRRWQQALGVKCQPLSTERRAEIARHAQRAPLRRPMRTTELRQSCELARTGANHYRGQPQ